jgi:hypothetical protein
VRNGFIWLSVCSSDRLFEEGNGSSDSLKVRNILGI